MKKPSSAALEKKPKTRTTRVREAVEWTVAYSYNSLDTKLPRVLLVGDSICNGYQQFVRDELAGTAYVAFWAGSKCVTDPSYLRQLSFFLDEFDYDVVHFNNGLHSTLSDVADYGVCLRAALKLVKFKAPNAKLIWATSTPVNDPVLGPNVLALNAEAAKVVAEEGLPVDDLFALLDPLDRKSCWSDAFHHTEATRKLTAKAVADCVRKALGSGKATAEEAAAALKGASTPTGPDGKLDASRK